MLKIKDSKDGFIVTLTRRGTSGAAMEALGEGSPGQDGGKGAASALSGVDEVIIGQSSRAMRSVTKEKTTPLRYSFPLSTQTPPASASAHGSLPRHCHPVVPPRGPDPWGPPAAGGGSIGTKRKAASPSPIQRRKRTRICNFPMRHLVKESYQLMTSAWRHPGAIPFIDPR